MEDPFSEMMQQVSVLLVDFDAKFLDDQIVNLLESSKYKVTMVMAPAAMSILFKEKKHIDVMIINVKSLDSHCFELLAQAVALNIIVLIVYDEFNRFLVKNALDNGAYLCLKKPLNEHSVKHLWQFVWGKKMQREKSIKNIETTGDHMNVDDDNYIVGDEEQAQKKNMSINTEEQSNDVVSSGKPKLMKKRGRKSTKEINEGKSQSGPINKIVTRKKYTKWTDDLRAKFTEAVERLGEGRCFPTAILELMNVPGLTTKQISSRLQKYRCKNQRPQEERKNTFHESSSGSQQTSSYNTSSERRSCERFGRMPHLQTNVPNQTQRDPEFSLVNTNNIFASSTQQLHHPQLQVQPNYLNPSLSVQNDVGGGLQQLQVQSNYLNPSLSSQNDVGGGLQQLQVQPNYLNPSLSSQNDVGGGLQQLQVQPNDLNPSLLAQNDVGGGLQQLQVQSNYLNPSLSAQNNVGGGLQQLQVQSNYLNPSLSAQNDVGGGLQQLQVQSNYLNPSLSAQNDVGGGLQQLQVQPNDLNPSLLAQNDVGGGLQQLHVQPNHLNPSLSAQNDVGGGLQQHGPLFGTMGSESPFIGSTNYRSRLAFNSGDHHTQNNYNLDLNAAHVTTSSNIDVETATINGLGATNTNFQQHNGEQNMFDPNNIVTASNANDIEESDLDELINWDAFANLNPMDDLFQNSISPSATLPNEHGSGRDTEFPDSQNSKSPDELST